MSRFFVGQRVRLVKATRSHHLVGRELVVTRIGFWPANPPRLLVDAEYEVDGFAVVASWQIEPILPDGHRACDEEFKRDLDKMLEGLPA